MAIELISKIKPKNNGDFKLVDVEDIEYNGKGLDEAIASGEFKGPKGDKGDAGEQGPAGQDGAAGPKGDQGEAGPTGPAGADGATWLFGSSDPTDQGKTGDFYLNTATFDVWSKATGTWAKTGNIKGATGAKGDKGDAGERGQQGVQGPKGDPGEAFAIAKTYESVEAMNAGFATDDVKEGQFVMIDTGNVEDEDNAKLYVKGAEAYNYITDLSGATGLTGPAGERGPQGVKGDKGDTGDPGAQGPKGDQGDTGAQGPKGDPGEQGPKGDAGPAGADGKTPSFEIRDGHLIAIYEE